MDYPSALGGISLLDFFGRLRCALGGAAASRGWAIRSRTLSLGRVVKMLLLLLVTVWPEGDVVWVNVVMPAGGGAGTGPAARTLTSFFRISNQKVAPNEMDKAVVSQPTIR